MKRTRALIVAAAVVIVIILVTSLSYYFISARSSVTVYNSKVQSSQYTLEYPTQSAETEPQAIGLDSNGNVWFTLQNISALAELTPSTGVIHEYKMPVTNGGGSFTWGLAVDRSRNIVWFTDQTTNSIWSFKITTHKFTQHVLKTPSAFPFDIALDQNGNAWFTEFFGNKIGEITTSGNLSEIPIPASGGLEASGITVASSGRVWFTLPGINSTGSYFDGQFSIQNLTGLVDVPVGIAADSKGNLWITQHGPSFISEFNPTTHFFKTISTSVPPILGSSLPYFVQIDQNGNIWVNEHQGNAMAEFFPSNNTMIEYFIPTRVVPVGNISGVLTMALSPAGQPWYTEFFSGKVGTISTSAPLDLGIRLTNYSSPLTMNDNSRISFGIEISGSASSQATLHEYVGNYTGNFQFSQVGSTLTINDNGSKPGVYFITIAAQAGLLAVSQIIEIRVS